MTELSDTFKDVGVFVTEFFGEELTFTRGTQGTYDPSTGDTGTPTVTNYSGNGATTEYSAFEKANGLVQENDLKLTMEVLSTTPLIGDTVVVQSKTYRVQDVSTTVVNSVIVLYTLQIRI